MHLPVTVVLSSGAFPNLFLTKRSRRFCPLINAVTHCLYRMFGCFALSLLKKVFTNLAASTAVAESPNLIWSYVSCILQYIKIQHSQMGRPAAPGIKVCGNCRVLLKPYIRTMYVYPFSEGEPSFSHI